MICQHFQKNRILGRSDPDSKAADVTRLTGSSPLIIADNTVMFIFLTKNPELRSELKEILKNYQKKIQNLDKRSQKASCPYRNRVGCHTNFDNLFPAHDQRRLSRKLIGFLLYPEFVLCHVLKVELVEMCEPAVPAPDRKMPATNSKIMGTSRHGSFCIPRCSRRFQTS